MSWVCANGDTNDGEWRKGVACAACGTFWSQPMWAKEQKEELTVAKAERDLEKLVTEATGGLEYEPEKAIVPYGERRPARRGEEAIEAKSVGHPFGGLSDRISKGKPVFITGGAGAITPTSSGIQPSGGPALPTQQCPNCKIWFTGTPNNCPSCGYNLKQSGRPPNFFEGLRPGSSATSEQIKKGEFWFCDKCYATNSRNLNQCSNCGAARPFDSKLWEAAGKTPGVVVGGEKRVREFLGSVVGSEGKISLSKVVIFGVLAIGAIASASFGFPSLAAAFVLFGFYYLLPGESTVYEKMKELSRIAFRMKQLEKEINRFPYGPLPPSDQHRRESLQHELSSLNDAKLKIRTDLMRNYGLNANETEALEKVE
ncbi:MAG TPA: hypothetical protein VJH90_03215 [archaeon]|nr:hypothetical protein [archaeon]